MNIVRFGSLGLIWASMSACPVIDPGFGEGDLTDLPSYLPALRDHDHPDLPQGNRLLGRAVLPAETFSPGPTSGTRLGSTPINTVSVPFMDKQPVQGFSAVMDNQDGTFWVMSDNGFGSIENSADHELRLYHIRPDFKTRRGGTGSMEILGFMQLSDPDHQIPFAITNHFTQDRILTGGDFDIESVQKAEDGTLWFGDEFGPFLLHTDADGKVLEAPIPLPDFVQGGEVRAAQNPFNEEVSALRVMNAVAAHAHQHGAKTPVFSPWDLLLADRNPATFVENRKSPPVGSGLVPASSELFSVAQLQAGGYPVVAWTVNEKARMTELMKLKVNGIISDRPDLLRQAVEEFDANGDGVPGDFLNGDGLIDLAKFDAQGHRGGRNLRPENTLPAMEVALDELMTTLETDTGITKDGIPVLNHDPHVQKSKCRLAMGTHYTDEVLVKDLPFAKLQRRFICDVLLPGRSDQSNDLSLSPVSVAFAKENHLHPYAMPSLEQLFAFARFYADYYRTGAGAGHADASRRARNAERVRFNIETKINPRQEFKHFTIGPKPFARAVAKVIEANQLSERCDIQSFDFRTLLWVQEKFPAIRTVYLFGDFPIYDDTSLDGSDDGTNLQPEGSDNTPWMAGLFWPYRTTSQTHPFRAQSSGGFEGMALSTDKQFLYPLLEKPLLGDDPRALLIHEFSLERGMYTGVSYRYGFEARGSAIGDFILFDATSGLVIERDGTQGDVNGYKAIWQITFGAPGEPVKKKLAVDLQNIQDPFRISEPGSAGDVGLGTRFSFPFVTIEDVVVFDRHHIGVINDNNFPFSVGRHVGSGRPDDSEFILIRLEEPLGN